MKTGTAEYLWAAVCFPFEADHAACQFCPLMHGNARPYCSRTGRYLSPDDLKVIPYDCPLEFEEKETKPDNA